MLSEAHLILLESMIIILVTLTVVEHLYCAKYFTCWIKFSYQPHFIDGETEIQQD